MNGSLSASLKRWNQELKLQTNERRNWARLIHDTKSASWYFSGCLLYRFEFDNSLWLFWFSKISKQAVLDFPQLLQNVITALKESPQPWSLFNIMKDCQEEKLREEIEIRPLYNTPWRERLRAITRDLNTEKYHTICTISLSCLMGKLLEITFRRRKWGKRTSSVVLRKSS